MTKSTSFVDLSDILPQDTADLEIMKPGGLDGTGWIVTFGGPGHAKTIAWNDAASRRQLRRAQQIESAQVNGRKFKPEDRDPNEVRRENVENIVARIVDWTPVSIGGAAIPFSDAAALDLLMNPRMSFALVQMMEFLGGERAFTKGSGKASEPMPSITSGSPA